MERSPPRKQLRARGSARLTLPYHLEAMQRLHAKEVAEEARRAKTDFMVRLHSISGEVLQEVLMKGEHRIRDLVHPWSRVFDSSFTEVHHSCELWRLGADQIDLTQIEADKESSFHVEYTWPDGPYAEAVLGEKLSAESDVRHVARALLLIPYEGKTTGKQSLRYLRNLVKVIGETSDGPKDFILLRPYLQDMCRCFCMTTQAAGRASERALKRHYVKDFKMVWTSHQLFDWMKKSFTRTPRTEEVRSEFIQVRSVLKELDNILPYGPECGGAGRDGYMSAFAADRARRFQAQHNAHYPQNWYAGRPW